MRSARFALLVVMLTYVAVTVGESILAPVLPIAAPEIGLDTAAGGRVLGVISLAAAVGNLAGGALLARADARVTSMVGAASSIAGCVVAAIAHGEGSFLAAHSLVGFGAGFYFAGGVFSVGMLSVPGRRGRAMGRYGIAYSLALALAAVLVATVGTSSWRAVYLISGSLAAVALVLLFFVELPGAQPIPRDELTGSVRLLGAPVLVGGVAAMAQFGLVSYIPTYAVAEWSLTASAAAMLLFAGRVFSIPGKAVAGWMIDRFGAKTSARLTGMAIVATGLVWVLFPVVAVGAAASIVVAAAAGAMFPMANVVAVERFGDLGGLLGVFRSAQMAIAGVSVWGVGQAAAAIGLTAALAIGLLSLSAILLLRPTSPADTARLAARADES
jgi:MFS family permease